MGSLKKPAGMAAQVAARARRVGREGAGLFYGPKVGWVETRDGSILGDLSLVERTGAVVAGV